MLRRFVSACFAMVTAVMCPAVLAQPLADVPPPPRLAETLAPARTASASALASSQTPAPTQARSPARAASAVPANTRVIEDDEVRIEESRGQRGQLQRITVRSKTGGTTAGKTSYEIIVGPAGQDPSQPRGNAGQRAWSLFDF